MAMLEVSELTAGYHRTPVLRDIDLEVDRGEIVGVMGKNGVGKTTLVKTIVGLIEPTTGAISYDGRDVTARSADERARMGIGYIPQGRDVFPDLTVLQNLRVGTAINSGVRSGPPIVGDAAAAGASAAASLRAVASDPVGRVRAALGDGEIDPAIERVFEYFPILEERADQSAGSLSGGQQQMLAIGRALAGDPDLLVLDEPSEGIQPSIVDRISEDIQTINRETDTTVLFVEQNLEVIRAMADRCYAMDRGTIQAELDGTTLEDPEATAEYLAI